jgi:GntR family transcriptional regulator, transcriptional repressor for pyruvate dehydrogenase complex
MTSETAAPPLSHQVYDGLLTLLGTDGYGPDVRLPSEQMLAQRFAVSRPVLRQALFRLRAEGHIYSRKGSGSFVRAPVAASPVIALGSLHSIPDVRNFLEFRCALEGEIAALAAERAAPQGTAEIERMRLAIEAALANDRPAIEEDIAFHAAIARASGNRFFAQTLTAVAEQTRFSIRLTRELSNRLISDRHAEVAREHAAISTAIASGNPDAAREAMTAHLRGGIKRLFDQ